jgi:hypothetical protein
VAFPAALEDIVDALELVVEGEEGAELFRGGAADGGLDAEGQAGRWWSILWSSAGR